MNTFEYSVEIEAPVEQVWAFSNDPENWTRINPSLRDLEIVEETDDGYVVDATYKMLGTSFDADIETTVVDEFEHTCSTFDSDGMSGEMHFYFRETDLGTEVTQTVEYEFGDSMVERILEPVAKRSNARQWKNALINAKELIEAEAEAEAEPTAA